MLVKVMMYFHVAVVAKINQIPVFIIPAFFNWDNVVQFGILLAAASCADSGLLYFAGLNFSE